MAKDVTALRGKVAIVGACESDEIGVLPGKSALTLHAEAARNALNDAGLRIGDVDGLFTAGVTSVQLGEYLGIVPRYSDGTNVGGCSFIMHVEHAMLAIAAGVIEVALITHGESGRSRVGMGSGGISPDSPQGQFEVPFGTSWANNSILAARDSSHARIRNHQGADGRGGRV